MRPEDENLRVMREVIGVLTDLGIEYALGGSWASSLQGEPRFTNDADITAEPFPGREAAFCGRFGPDYYVSLPAVQEAVSRRSSFNLIHLDSGYKVDVFIRKDRPFDQSVMRRRVLKQLHDTPGPPIMVVSPEDIILLKLEWYRLGKEISDRQWNDVLGVLKTQAGRLDDAYLDHWAADLGISDLLARAREELKSRLGSSS